MKIKLLSANSLSDLETAMNDFLQKLQEEGGWDIVFVEHKPLVVPTPANASSLMFYTGLVVYEPEKVNVQVVNNFSPPAPTVGGEE